VKRGVLDLLRRGFDNTLANWPIILIRLGETMLFGAIVVASVIAVVVPLLVSIGISFEQIRTIEDIEGLLDVFVRNGLLVVLYIFGLVTVVTLVMTLVHAFVTAGCARVYLDGDRVAGGEMPGPRRRYGVFSMERWMAGSTSGWWTIFWIYNFAWGAAGIVLLIPLVPTLAAMLLLHDARAEVSVGIGCLGILATLFLAILTGIVVTLWSTRAIAAWAHRRHGARDALAIGWRAMNSDFGRHLLIGVAVVVVGMAGSSFFASFSLFGTFAGIAARDQPLFALVGMPVRVVGWLLSSAFSAAVGGWFLASNCAVENEAGGYSSETSS
jgi:hypothetical protein